MREQRQRAPSAAADDDGPMRSAPRLIADVGGTNVRFALHRGGRDFECVEVLAGADFAGLDVALGRYLEMLGPVLRAQLRHAAIGIATAVTGDEVRMTNHPWRFSIAQLRRAFGLETLLVLNDFTALAWSLPHLPPHELRQIGGGAALPDAPRALLGAGTGLGVSALLPDARGGFTALAGEGGHVSFAPVDERELLLWRAGRAEFGRISVERLLSGPGLEFMHRTLAPADGAPALAEPPVGAAEITRRAFDSKAPDAAACRATVDAFLAILGSVAGDLALTLGARGGVYIGGGIVPRLAAHLPQSSFRARFEDKGRFAGYLAALPVYLIESPFPALVGAAVCLDAHLGAAALRSGTA